MKGRAFTLVEVMVVVAVIVILAAIAIPSLIRSICTANESSAIGNLKTICTAMEVYASANGGQYPATEQTLTHALPPYLTKTYSNQTVSGYGYNYSLSESGYQVIASPNSQNFTGVNSYQMITGCRLTNLGIVSGGGGGGGSCPFLWVWDGRNFVKDNDIIPAATNSTVQYTDYYVCSRKINPRDGKYLFRIAEEKEETSYIDKIKLLAVDHPADVGIAPDTKGKIWTFSKPLKPASVLDTNNQDQLSRISSRGDDFYVGKKGDYLLMDFGRVNKAEFFRAKLIIASDNIPDPDTCQEPPPEELPLQSLHLEFLDNNGKWVDTKYVIHPHEGWDIWALDLSKFSSKVGDFLKLKLIFTAAHKLDYVGLSLSNQQPVVTSELPILQARNSKGKDELKNITSSNKVYAILKKGDYLDLEFPCYNKPILKRDFIFVSEGYYLADGKITIPEKKK